MKPLAILSTDMTPDYLFCLPIVARSWKLQGWKVNITLKAKSDGQYGEIIEMMCKYMLPAYEFNNAMCDVDSYIKSPNEKLYIQCCRLYEACNTHDDDYCIIGDIDMFIASDFLNRDYNKVNVFGHDLTDFNEIPMCYVGAKSKTWTEIMGDTVMEDDLKMYSKYQSNVWHEAWGADQQILTAKLKKYGFDKINFINRGVDPDNQNLPLGRWDRYGGFKRPRVRVHDVHLPRQPWASHNYEKIVNMCRDIYPMNDWGWLASYRTEFLQTINI